MLKTIAPDYSDLITLVDIIQKRALIHPEKVAYTFLENSEEVQSITYLELDLKAKSIAMSLRKKLVKGDRALLLYKPGLEYIVGFFGCLYAGVIAVPAYPPDPSRLGRMLPRLLSIVDDCQPKIILTTSDISAQLKLLSLKAPSLFFKSWLSTDKVKNLTTSYHQETLALNDISFLQYTSGSTGLAKGVMITHANLIHNCETMHKARNSNNEDRFLTWLPLYHDMGLIGIIIQGAYAGLSAWVMSPFDFLRNPFNWLNSISKYKISITGGPNFAYQLCHSKITEEQKKSLDLSSWTMAYSGAEPIREETFNRFAEKFSDVGFSRKSLYTCYGLAESTVFVSGSISGQGFICKTNEANNLNYISCGRAVLDDTAIRIVNPEAKKVCTTNEVGEVWISSPSVAAGYWGKAELSVETFENKIVGDERTYLKTGDLAFADQHGEIFITGRIKDLIIINGQNHYPSDFEDTIVKHCHEIRPGCLAGFAVKGETTEKVVLVAELRKGVSASQMDALQAKIKKIIFTEHELALADIVFVVSGTIPKTTSGKIQRNATKEAYLKQQLSTMKRVSTKAKKHFNFKSLFAKDESPAEAVLIQLIAEELKISPSNLSGASSFAELGLSSLQVVSVAGQLSEKFKIDISPALFWSYKDISSLARHIKGESTTQATAQPALQSATTRVASSLEQDDIAIIGMSARFPGAENTEQFWKNLEGGVDSITQERGPWAGYVKNVDAFDPLFFGISPREAEVMDPQQRLALEVVWEALERAGIAPSSLSGTNAGVFFGVSSHDYVDLIKSHQRESDLQVATGNAHSIVANRISFLLNLKGPSLAIDTACSSSLVAVHEAVKALKFKDCSVAIAGGVNVLIDENITATFARAGMLSPDGRCFTFDQKANGYVRGEGCGTLVLKPLQEALKDKNPVLGIIRASGVAHGGVTNSLTAPSAISQAELIEKTYLQSNVHPNSVGHIEAHGTATKLGDPIELLGLQQAFQNLTSRMNSFERDQLNPCYIGSVKSNIGHLEAAAGIAGLIKTVLMLQHKKIPQTVHFNQLNSSAQLNSQIFVVNNQLRDWPVATSAQKNLPRRAGVSSFGFGGMNAHIVLEEAPTSLEIEKNTHGVVIVISAKTQEQLTQARERYIQFLSHTKENLASVAYTSQVGRETFSYRLAVTGTSPQEVIAKLTSLKNIYTGQVKKNNPVVLSQAQDLDSVAQSWVRGETVAWEKLYTHLPQKIQIPTYPFDQKKYWIGQIATSSETNFFQEFLNRSQFFIKDHVVVEDTILPGVVHLEFIRRAVAKKWPNQVFALRDVVWKKPVVVGEQGLTLNINFKPENETLIQFEVGNFSQGKIDFKAPNYNTSAFDDFSRIYEKLKSFELKTDVYEHFADLGLKYGPSFQGIQKMYSGENESFAEINLGNFQEKNEFELHPSLMDAALGTCIGIKALSAGPRDRVYIPFSLEKLEIFGAVNGKCFSYAQLSADAQSNLPDAKKYDVTVYNEQGKVLVRFIGAVVRPVVLNKASKPRLIELQKTLQSKPLEKNANRPDVLFLKNEIPENLNAKFIVIQQDLEFVFHLYQKLISKPVSEKMILTCVLEEGANYTSSKRAAIRGFVSSLKNSHPQIDLNLVTVDEATTQNASYHDLLSQEAVFFKSEEVVFKNSQRYVRGLEILPSRTSSEAKLEREGVYLISGGAGGIGKILTQYLSQMWNAQVFVLGRSTAVKLEHGKYIQCDITDRGQVKKMLTDLYQQGIVLNGIIHAAGVVSKKTIQESTWSSFQETLFSKVEGAIVLDELTASLKLDFFMVTSSISSFMGDFGAGDYAAANAALDDFSERRAELVQQGLRHGESLCVNWPLWESGGMSMPLEQQQISEKILGFKPLPNSVALSVFEKTRSSIVMYGDVKKIKQNLGLTRKLISSTPMQNVSTIEEKLSQILSETLKIDIKIIDVSADFSEYGADSMTMMDFMDKVKKVYGEVITPALLFENKQIRSLARVISENTSAPIAELTPAEKMPALSLIQPLSKAQEAMWFIYELAPDSCAYNIPIGLKMNGAVDKLIVKRSLEILTQQQPQLRTVFIRGQDTRQMVLENAGVAHRYIDVSSFDASDIEASILLESQKPFSLTDEPGFRSLLLKRKADEFELILTAHHIVFDGLSLMLVLKQFIQIYETLAQGQSIQAVPVDQNYFKFIEKQKAFINSPQADKQWNFWKEKLSGQLTPLQLPQDRLRPQVQTYNGATYNFTLDKNIFDELKIAAKKEKVTVNSMLLSAFYIFLNKYSGQDDFIVGTPVLGRDPEMCETIGYFVNMLPLREKIQPQTEVKDFVHRVHHDVGEALLNQTIPFPLLVEKMKIPRDPSRSPLFQVCFVFQNMLKDPLFEKSTSKKKFEYFHIPQQEGQFDLELEILDSADHFTCHFKFNTDLFDASTVQRFGKSYGTILEAMIKRPSQNIASVSALDPKDLDLILNQFNDTEHDYQNALPLHQIFERQVVKTPEAVAVQFGNESLTYRELNMKANQLAHYLINQGVGPDALVGVCAQRSLEMVISLYAILKAGGAYVPIEPTYPEKRIEFLFADAKVKYVLTQDKFKDLVSRSSSDFICVDRDWSRIEKMKSFNPEIFVTKNNLAYMIYTSGSTGAPKGAMNTHAGICNRLLWMQQAYQLKEDDVILQKTPFSFDVSVWEFFWPLMFGAKMVLLAPEGHKDASLVAQVISEYQVTTLHFVPSMLNVFLDQPRLPQLGKSLRRVICSGEALPMESQKTFFKTFSCELHNLYGPTEASVDVTYWACDPQSSLNYVPIGKPISNIKMFILDSQFQPVPIGVGGELCISGVGLARGYHNRDELNAEKFILNPLDQSQKSRLYRTGDLARYNQDGIIEYLGRIDHQVKIRGFRIELGEIESLLAQRTDIKDVVVVARPTQNGPELVAYIVSQDKKEILPHDLRDFLRKELPEYMVPAKFVFLYELPLSSNGKVDRKALPEPKNQRAESQKEHILPRNQREEKIHAIWRQGLGLEKICVTDNFFDLGGNSLLSIRMVKNINDELQANLTIRDFYENPTIEVLARRLVEPQNTVDLSQQLIKDALLDPQIQFAALSDIKVSRIFLTGVTGFLGAYLLRDLLENTTAKILCLVRCENDFDGLQRIQSNLEKYSIWKSEYRQRISAIKGDLGRPYLGIDPYQWDYLTEKVQIVYHNAAKVNFVQPYSYLKNENVLGTQEVLRLCGTGLLKPLHYISTVSVFDSSIYKKVDILDEEATALPKGLFSGYAQSKWVAEEMVKDAQRRGLPACIYRPGTVTGDSSTGISNPDDLMTRILVAAIQLGYLPRLNRSFDMVPVDFVAQAIIKLSLAYPGENKMFHIVNPQPLAMAQLKDLYFQLGYELKDLDYADWTEMLVENKDNALNVLLPLFTEKVSGTELAQAQLSELKPMVKTVSTFEELKKINISCPIISKELIELYLLRSLPQFIQKKSA